MSLKGQVQPNATVTNQFRLTIDDLPPVYFTRMGELERMLQVAEQADETNVSTGRVPPGEFEADQYAHHDAEVVAMEAWHRECEFGAPGYKKSAQVDFLDASGTARRSWELQGLINRGRTSPEFQRGEDGDDVVLTWTLAYDDWVLL